MIENEVVYRKLMRESHQKFWWFLHLRDRGSGLIDRGQRDNLLFILVPELLRGGESGGAASFHPMICRHLEDPQKIKRISFPNPVFGMQRSRIQDTRTDTREGSDYQENKQHPQTGLQRGHPSPGSGHFSHLFQAYKPYNAIHNGGKFNQNHAKDCK